MGWGVVAGAAQRAANGRVERTALKCVCVRLASHACYRTRVQVRGRLVHGANLCHVFPDRAHRPENKTIAVASMPLGLARNQANQHHRTHQPPPHPPPPTNTTTNPPPPPPHPPHPPLHCPTTTTALYRHHCTVPAAPHHHNLCHYRDVSSPTTTPSPAPHRHTTTHQSTPHTTTTMRETMSIHVAAKWGNLKRVQELADKGQVCDAPLRGLLVALVPRRLAA